MKVADASNVLEKAEDWLLSGCREVWLIDPRREAAWSCTWSDNALVQRRVEQLTSETVPRFSLTVTELFARD